MTGGAGGVGYIEGDGGGVMSNSNDSGGGAAGEYGAAASMKFSLISYCYYSILMIQMKNRVSVLHQMLKKLYPLVICIFHWLKYV